MRRLCPKVQPLTLLYATFDKKGTIFTLVKCAPVYNTHPNF